MIPPGDRPGDFQPRNSPQLPSPQVKRDHGRIPLRRDPAAPFPSKINCRIFTEKPREFIDIYRNFQKLLFALFLICSSTERNPGV